jgi:hypothetical protein
MAIDTDQRLALAMTIPGAPVWRLSLEQYHRMIQTGILTDDDPVEFLEGLLVTKMPKNPPHSLATHLTRDALARVVPAQWYVDAQEPFTTARQRARTGRPGESAASAVSITTATRRRRMLHWLWRWLIRRSSVTEH